MRRKHVAAAIAPLALVFCACAVGTPTPSTDVSETGATLNGTVKSSLTGPTEYWWRYGRTSSYGSETPRRTIELTANASAEPVSEPVTDLRESTTVHFQFCVQDKQEPPRPICSTDRTLATVGDYVRGAGAVFNAGSPVGLVTFDNVRSGSAGENPAGLVHHTVIGVSSTTSTVTCLFVDGDTAVMGLNQPGPLDTYVLMDVAQGTYSEVLMGTAPPDNCAAAPTPIPPIYSIAPFGGPLTVHDQP